MTKSNGAKSVFTSETACEMCQTVVVAIDLELVKIDIGEFWACDDCRKDLRTAKEARVSCGYRSGVYEEKSNSAEIKRMIHEQ